MNEFDFICLLRKQTESRKQSARILKGIGDDATLIREAADRDLVVTTDLLVEEIDFHFAATPAALLGHKALAVSLSDIAAMGARPRWSMISFGLPREIWDEDFKDKFFAGYFSLADQYGVNLVGGDISESKERMVIDSIVMGEVSKNRAVLRSTAQPGDEVYVTGFLGAAAAGVKLIELGARVKGVGKGVSTKPPAGTDGFHYDPNASEDGAIERVLLRQLRPEPRVGWGIILGEERLATSMIDISDGLSSDLNHLCEESKVGALIDAGAIPIDEDVKQLCGRRALDPLSLALHGGEDFELLFTVAPENVQRLPKRVDGVTISRIGRITVGTGVRISEKDRVWDLKAQGFKHFGAQPDEQG